MAMSVQQFLMEKRITLINHSIPQTLHPATPNYSLAFMVSVLVHLKLQMKHGSRPAHCTKGGFL
jgi:hypothetical protein